MFLEGHGSPGCTRTSRLAGVGVCGLPGWVRPLLENCIVDASIFEFFQDCSVMIAGEGSLLFGWLLWGMLSWFL